MPSPALISPALWQGLCLEWLWVYHGVVPRVREWSQEIGVPPGVFFVESGEVRIQAEGREITVKPGHAFFSAPGVRRQWFEAGTRLLSVGLRCQFPDGRPLYQTGLNVAFPARGLASLQSETHRLFSAVHGRRKKVSYAEGKALQNRSVADWARHEAAFRQWFAEYASTLESKGIRPAFQSRPEDRRLQRLCEWLQTRPLDAALDWTGIAEELQLSSRRMQQLLREELGTTAQTHLEKRRLEHACQRLSQEDVPLKEIAFSLGFRHPPHFTTWFRRHLQMTPTAYRSGHLIEGA